MFWACMLSGAAGHTYGANGIWQVNTAAQPFGPSPHGRSWGDTPWDVASELPGSRQLGWAKALLMRYPWWRIEPHPEWVEPHWTAANYIQPYCAGIPRELRIVFMPPMWDAPKMMQLEPGLSYRAFYFNPATGNGARCGNGAGGCGGCAGSRRLRPYFRTGCWCSIARCLQCVQSPHGHTELLQPCPVRADCTTTFCPVC